MAPPPTTVQVVPPGKLVYGMQLPIVAQSSLFAAPWEAEAGTDELRRIAEACDRSGFFYLGVCDHVCIPRARAGAMSTAWHDTVATLGFLAAAKAFATLDALSGGRVIVGVGAGHLEAEFAALGVPFAGRGRRLDEAID